MNKRKAEQAERTSSKGRKRVVKDMRGGRVVVVTPAQNTLLSLMKPQMPIRQRLQMEKHIARIEAENAAAGFEPIVPPVIDLNAPYVPGEATVPLGAA
jgi:hypothetical protein